MPKIKLEIQLKYLPWIYAAAFVLFVILGAQIIGFFQVMLKSDERAAHSREVLKAHGEAKNLFLEAETKGRYASFDKEAKRDFPILSQKTIELVKNLPEIVKDNETQIANADHIIQAVNARFETQNKTINAAVLVNGTLQSNPQIVSEGLTAQIEAITAFAAFESEEQRLSLERYEAFWSSLWSIGIRGAIAFSLLVITSFLGGGWTWRALKKSYKALSELGSGKADKNLEIENERLKQTITRAELLLDS